MPINNHNHILGPAHIDSANFCWDTGPRKHESKSYFFCVSAHTIWFLLWQNIKFTCFFYQCHLAHVTRFFYPIFFLWPKQARSHCWTVAYQTGVGAHDLIFYLQTNLIVRLIIGVHDPIFTQIFCLGHVRWALVFSYYYYNYIQVQSTPFIKLGSIDVSALLKKRLIKVMFYNENN